MAASAIWAGVSSSLGRYHLDTQIIIPSISRAATRGSSLSKWPALMASATTLTHKSSNCRTQLRCQASLNVLRRQTSLRHHEASCPHACRRSPG
jgi:hypothetical protein